MGSVPDAPRIACLYVPDFRLQVALQCFGEDPEGGLALVDPDDGRRLIVAASPNARLDGIKRGLTAVTATSLAPELVVREVDREALAETHRGLEEAVRSLTPTFETTGSGVIYASFAGLERRYRDEGEGGFLDELREVTRLLGLPVRVGMASTRFCARAAAVLEGKLGQVASTLVPSGQEAEFLKPLPVELLPDAIELIASLKRLGIRSLGAFAALPPAGVARRYGARGSALHRLARGIDRGTLVPAPEPRDDAVLVHAEYPIVHTEALRFLLKEPLERLIGSLDGEGLACRVLRWELCIDGGEPLHLETGSASPSGSLRLWMDLVKVELERLVLPGGVLSVRITAQEVGPRPADQERLTGPRAAPPGALPITLAHLAAEVGLDQFGVLLPQPSLLPDDRQEVVVAGGLRVRGRRLLEPESLVPDRTPTGCVPAAFRRVTPPERVEVELRGGQPTGFRHRGGWQPAERCFGPWDVSGGWWQTERRRRTWQVQGRGAVAQVYTEDEGWFLEGWLD